MSKKGISIGATLRQRMETSDLARDELAGEDRVQTPAKQAESDTSIHSSIMPRAGNGHAQLQATDDPLESFNTRLRRSVQHRLKVYSALNSVKIQDAVAEALDNFLTQKKA